MLNEQLKDLGRLRESVALEGKLAHGHDGKGALKALANTLVHADFTGRISVLVVKEPAGFSFRNPGGLRVPAALALQGGVSDCRNRSMQQMFLMIGLGERAGSGMSRILHGWQDLGHTLRLAERYEPQEHSVLEMGWASAALTPTVSTEPGGVNDGVNDPARMLRLDALDQQLLALIRQNPPSPCPSWRRRRASHCARSSAGSVP